MNKYFVIPFENVPLMPSYAVWFAAWSDQRPNKEPGMPSPFAVGVTADDRLPAGATLLAEGPTKDPPPPPPPLGTGGLDEYRNAFNLWLNGIKEE